MPVAAAAEPALLLLVALPELSLRLCALMVGAAAAAAMAPVCFSFSRLLTPVEASKS